MDNERTAVITIGNEEYTLLLTTIVGCGNDLRRSKVQFTGDLPASYPDGIGRRQQDEHGNYNFFHNK